MIAQERPLMRRSRCMFIAASTCLLLVACAPPRAIMTVTVIDPRDNRAVSDVEVEAAYRYYLRLFPPDGASAHTDDNGIVILDIPIDRDPLDIRIRTTEGKHYSLIIDIEDILKEDTIRWLKALDIMSLRTLTIGISAEKKDDRAVPEADPNVETPPIRSGDVEGEED